MRLRLEEAETRCYCLTDKAEASRFKIRVKREAEEDLMRALEGEAERRGTIKAEVSTGEEIEEEKLEGETRRREEAEAQIGVATEALERSDEESNRRESEEALKKAEEGERS